MRYLWGLLLFALHLCAQNAQISALAAPIAYSGAAIFPIDPKNRGLDIISMINILSTNSFYNTNSSEVAILTTRNGLLRNVTSSNVITTTNNTILIIGALPSKGASISNLTFYVIPVEQIAEVIYSQYAPVATLTAYNVTMTTGILPVYPVDPSQRAADIISAIGIIKANTNPNNNTGNYFRYNSKSGFSFQTSLTGPFPPASNPQLAGAGTINYVQCVSLSPPITTTTPCSGNTPYMSNGTLLFITYNTKPNYTTQAYYIIANPDQIYGITYSPGA